MPNDDSTFDAWLRQLQPEADLEEQESQEFFTQHAFPEPPIEQGVPESPEAPAAPAAPERAGEPAEIEQPEGVQVNSALAGERDPEEEQEFFSVGDTLQGLAAGAVEGTANILDTTSQLLEACSSPSGSDPAALRASFSPRPAVLTCFLPRPTTRRGLSCGG